MIIMNGMKTNTMHTRRNEEGIALLVTLLLLGVLLAIGASLLNVTLKQYQFSGMALASETAFQAANGGMECVLYHDNLSTSVFDVPGDGSNQATAATISCFNNQSDTNSNGAVGSGDEQHFQFDWGSNPSVCSDVSVYKFYSTTADVPVVIDGVAYRSTDCPQGGICTVVQARGYDVPCSDVGTAARVVEREYTIVY
jgi:hypothetical protein